MQRLESTRRLAVVFAILWGVAVVCSGCFGGGGSEPSAGAAVAKPRLVVLYAACTVNKSFLSPYSPNLSDTTPHLARFAEEAVVFEHHQTEAGQSGTAFASLFAGTGAEHHGVFQHPTQLEDDVELIGEVFHRRGFEVATWLEHRLASAELGYAQGASATFDRALHVGDPAFTAILEHLRGDPSARALLITNFTVTHTPYFAGSVESFCQHHPEDCSAYADRDAFARWAELHRRHYNALSFDFPATARRLGLSEEEIEDFAAAVELMYRANIAYLDYLFGRLMDQIRAAGLWEETAVVFTADHGETLYRPETLFHWTHGYQLAPEVLGVPLLIKTPGLAPGRYAGVTRSMDVLPTLAGLVGVEGAPKGEGFGVDLSAALRGEEAAPRLVALSHSGLPSRPVLEEGAEWGLWREYFPRRDPELLWVERRDADHAIQLRRTPGGTLEPKVFNVAADPRQLDNLLDLANPEQRRALRELAAYRERLITAWHAREGDDADRDLGEAEQRELLRSLGYVD